MTTWIRPTIENLKHEYDIEYVMKGVGALHTNSFGSFEEFYSAAEKGEVVDLTPAVDSNISYRSHTSTKQQLINLLKSYRSWPEFRNYDTVENLYDRIGNGKPMTMPVVLRFANGSMRILGGNTRLDVAFQLGKTPRVLIIDAL